VRVWTVHVAPLGLRTRTPELIPERFSLAAALLGPLWLLTHRAWIPGLLSLAVLVLLAVWVGGSWWPAWLVYAWASGLFGNDLRRWSLARGGFVLTNVVAARDADAAFARLLAGRPDLVARLA
jgi:hypothetical protein